MRKFWTTCLMAALSMGGAAQAQDIHVWEIEDSFENVTFAVENAIIGQGLVIDHTSHVGDMLERTKADVGASKTIFTGAQIFSFCSASVSRAVMETDPALVQFCPYGIFVYETPGRPGTVAVGFRDYPEGPMDQVEDLLSRIIAEALMLED
ncbi:DUF302 domain-containing protein [Phaeovulum sp. NW3]|uniref:DUF302 domain-containing protein n=1 Tax=Phaeovulum sp. NW3 TaxID=2934933 RepID=UPI0020219DFA|nr:DUF302 domain-containing protein [Phaeovulum sp. NW3]MCL7466479.1 DUF302 domain-containing protein [Phaeovulum sp. NW3]